ncbi:hypothetical protein [Streptomyces mobaraensis]|uniref:hypothetical protein n=1 Tax=Streptomyces mobaraensis TaxID=35621 RepID=UPI003411A2AC
MADRNQGKDPRRPFERAPVPDFINVSHEDLRAMIEHADAGRIDRVVKKLHEAANTIRDIGNDLKEHAGKVDMRSEGGAAFHTWSADMGNATLRLADYSEKAGDWLAHAANTLRAVKTEMPPVPTAEKATLAQFDKLYPGFRGNPLLFNSDVVTSLHKDGPSTFQVTAAAKKIADAHKEAAAALRKLANQYNDSGEEISRADRPNFPPMPGVMMPPGAFDGTEHIALGGSAGGGGAVAAAGGGGAATVDGATGGNGGGAAVPGGGPSGGAPGGGPYGGSSGGSPGGTTTVPSADRPDTSTRVDGGVSVPTVPNGGQPAPPLPGPSAPSGPAVPPRLPPGPVPGMPPSVPPTWPGSVPPGPKQRGGRGAEGPRGRSVPPGAERGREPGRGGVVTPRNPVGPGLPGVSGVPPIRSGGPADGVMGGRPAPRTRGQGLPAAPRGTVVGAEPATGPAGQGRPGAAYGPGFAGAPGGGGGAARTGGRRLASENGGVVGGRAPRGAVAEGRPFTRGGSGLVRGTGEARNGRNGDAAGKRQPDHLTEEEGAWGQGEHRNVPPVVD